MASSQTHHGVDKIAGAASKVTGQQGCKYLMEITQSPLLPLLLSLLVPQEHEGQPGGAHKSRKKECTAAHTRILSKKCTAGLYACTGAVRSRPAGALYRY